MDQTDLQSQTNLPEPGNVIPVPVATSILWPKYQIAVSVWFGGVSVWLSQYGGIGIIVSVWPGVSMVVLIWSGGVSKGGIHFHSV